MTAQHWNHYRCFQCFAISWYVMKNVLKVNVWKLSSPRANQFAYSPVVLCPLIQRSYQAINFRMVPSKYISSNNFDKDIAVSIWLFVNMIFSVRQRRSKNDSRVNGLTGYAWIKLPGKLVWVPFSNLYQLYSQNGWVITSITKCGMKLFIHL